MWFALIPTKLETVKPGWYNAADYGVVPSSSVDVSYKLQDLTYMVSDKGGGTIYLPPGVYLLESGLALLEGVNLVGAGRERVILQGPEDDYIHLDLYPGATMSGLTLVGGWSTWVVVEEWNQDKPLVIDSVDFDTVCSEWVPVRLIQCEYVHFSAPVVFRNCRFMHSGCTQPHYIEIVTFTGSTVFDNCVFRSTGNESIVSLIQNYYSTVELRNCTWYGYDRDVVFMGMIGGRATISNMHCVLQDGSYYLLSIGEEVKSVILGGLEHEGVDYSFDICSQRHEKVAVIEGLGRLARLPEGASLVLPTNRTVDQTSWTTAKRFSTTLTGEVRMRISLWGNGSGHVGEVRVLRDGQQIFHTVTDEGSAVYNVSSQVRMGDTIELQLKAYENCSIEVHDFAVYYIPCFTGDFYNLLD